MADPFKLDLLHRPRRLRRHEALRALVQETTLSAANFIAPLFVVEGEAAPEPIANPYTDDILMSDLTYYLAVLQA